jgi:hypothetical protein
MSSVACFGFLCFFNVLFLICFVRSFSLHLSPCIGLAVVALFKNPERKRILRGPWKEMNTITKKNIVYSNM